MTFSVCALSLRVVETGHQIDVTTSTSGARRSLDGRVGPSVVITLIWLVSSLFSFRSDSSPMDVSVDDEKLECLSSILGAIVANV